MFLTVGILKNAPLGTIVDLPDVNSVAQEIMNYFQK